MKRGDGVILTRDVLVTIIPQGEAILLFAGTLVRIMQALGGTHTIEFNNQWLMVHEEDADAVGVIVASEDIPQGTLMEQIWTSLRNCYDPEIPVNIVDLGLIYEVNLNDNILHIVMTLTATGCGMGPVIVQEIERKMRRLKIQDVKIEVVFDPPWSQELFSDEAKLILGLL